MPAMPSPRPRTPPIIESTTLSVSSWRMIRAAARAHRRADGDLAPANGRAHEQQVRDVGARNQQDEGHRADQHPQRAADVANDDVLHRIEAERGLAAERGREHLAEFRRRLAQLRLRLPRR